MRDQLKNIFQSVCSDLFHIETVVELTRPESNFGDFSTNLALKIAKQLKKPPTEIAEIIAKIVNNQKNEIIDKVTIAGPGFINIKLTFQALHESYTQAVNLPEINTDKLVLVEFGDPNPFKEMHLGHFYDAVEGDTIARLLEISGANVKRLSYHGDVGLQIARSIWGIGVSINWELDKLDNALSSNSLGSFYAKGAQADESDEEASKFIREINDHIYNKDDDLINEIYKKGWEISFQKFDHIFKQIDVKHDKRYLESDSSKLGIETVKKNIGTVFVESEGAVVYQGEKVGLHTRVFINSRGLPTYETKDLGLVELKDIDYPNAEKSIIVTAYEQNEYFKVMLAALNEINPKLAKKTAHISHGFLTLTTGKMSSRTGDVYEAQSLIDEVKKAINSQYPESEVQEEIFMAAIRYTFLKQRLGSDIIFDVKESVGLEGNSGPYIQYAHARARSILAKVEHAGQSISPEFKLEQIPLQDGERKLAMKMSEFSEIFERSLLELMPHHICTYLFELSHEFNSFYESNRVINDERMFTRLHLVSVYADILQKGLKLLNIPAPDYM